MCRSWCSAKREKTLDDGLFSNGGKGMSLKFPPAEVDYLIIGGGRAGCVLAFSKFYKQST
jgi:hypothetical protein